MNAQRRRQKQAEHVREVERLLAFRRQLYEAMRVSSMGGGNRGWERGQQAGCEGCGG